MGRQRIVYPTLAPLILGGMLLWADVIIPGLIITLIGIVIAVSDIIKE
jgi:hypothetical protein